VSKWFKLSFALALILVVVPLTGCLKGPTGMTETQFKSLLTLPDIQKLSTPSDIAFVGTFYDYKTDPNSDPSKTLHMDDYYGMVFMSDDQSTGVALSLVDFDSAQVMQQYLLSIQTSSQLQPMSNPIAMSSMEKEFNSQGLGSVVVFQRGNTLVELLTGVADGAKPFMPLSNLETLARQIAAKI
jgi:hypothetical protein